MTGVCVIFVLFVSLIGRIGQPSAGKEETYAQAAPSPSPTASSVRIPYLESPPQFQNEGQNEEGTNSNPIWVHTPDKGISDWIAYGANLALVIVGFGGIGVGIRSLAFLRSQTKEIRLQRIVTHNTLNAVKRQADLMHKQASLMGSQTDILRESVAVADKAAKAAQTSALVAANSERGWLITTQARFAPAVAHTGTSEVLVQFHNAGRSPAEIISAYCISILYPSDWIFPEEPMYDGLEDLMEITAIPGEIIPAGEKRLVLSHIRHARVLTQEQLSEVAAGINILYCYGRVEYKDITGVERVTQFGYRYIPKSDHGPGMLPAMYRMKNRAFNFTT